MQKEIQLTDKTLLVVGLPEKANKLCTIRPNAILIEVEGLLLSIPIPDDWHDGDWHDGDWQLLGIYPELTEEQAITINATPAIMPKFGYRYEYVSALESFQSLMERENITGYEKYAILIKNKGI